MNIQGRDCTLTVARDGIFIPLPYSEETVRQMSKGYSLPFVIGKRNRDKFILSKKAVTGCFVTRLDYNCVEQLFLLLFYDNEVFDIYTDRVYEKAVYKNLTFKSFELRATNGDAFKFHLDVKETENTYIENWPVNIPALPWISNRTYIYDGHTVTADNKRLPLIHRFELNAPEQRDKKLTEKLIAENCGSLNWLIQGYSMLKKEGLREEPDAVRDANIEYRMYMDVVGTFVNDCFEIDASMKWKLHTKILYETYLKGCNKNNERAMSQKWLGLRMQEKGFKRIVGNSQHLWLGVVLKEEWRG